MSLFFSGMPKKRPPTSRLEDPEVRALYKRVGRRIRQLRLRAGLTQREASVSVFGTDVHQGEWSRWEGGHMLPNVATLHRIATWAGVGLGDLGLFEAEASASRVDLEAVRRALVDALEVIDSILPPKPSQDQPSRARARPRVHAQE